MIIVRNVRQLEDGTYQLTWNLAPDQIEFLLTFAINHLLAEGLVSIEDQAPESPEEAKKQRELDFLNDLDEEDLHQA